MPITFSDQLGLEKPDRYIDELWTPWSNNADMLNRIIGGYLSIAQGDADYTLLDTAANRESRTLALKFTTTLTAARVIKIPVSSGYRSRLFVIWNASSGAFKLTIKTTAGGSTGPDINQGKIRAVWHDGTNVYPVGPEIDATTFLVDAGSVGGAWASWTPTFTNLTVGNGTLTAKFIKIGKTIICRLHFVFGSTSSMGTTPSFTLPVASVSYPGTSSAQVLGDGQYYDTSAAQNYGGNIIWKSTADAYLGVFDASATYLKTVTPTSAIPFNWGVGDEIHATFTFEAA